MEMAKKRLGINPLHLAVEDRIGPELKVWWIPQIPGKAFDVFLNSFAEAWVILEALPQYDLFQLDHNIKPDFSNVGGLMIRADDGEWEDWENGEGETMREISHARCIEMDREFYDETLRQAEKS